MHSSQSLEEPQMSQIYADEDIRTRKYEHLTILSAIFGAAMEVHKLLGNGFLEAVYQDALEKELICEHLRHLRLT
jgi:hypothetical protein